MGIILLLISNSPTLFIAVPGVPAGFVLDALHEEIKCPARLYRSSSVALSFGHGNIISHDIETICQVHLIRSQVQFIAL
jgi:hypothetical protein